MREPLRHLLKYFFQKDILHVPLRQPQYLSDVGHRANWFLCCAIGVPAVPQELRVRDVALVALDHGAYEFKEEVIQEIEEEDETDKNEVLD